MSNKNKTSFSIVILLAVLSFLFIYFLCPNFSEKTIGVSFKSPRSQSFAKINKENVDKALSTGLDKAANAVTRTINKVSDTVEDVSRLLEK